jgi:uncharacterized SAM-binding protein YcdF (DUF218 family)
MHAFLIHFLLNPLTILWVFILIFLFLSVFKHRRLSIVFLAISGVWIFIISISPLPQWIVYRLEKQYPVFDLRDHISGKGANILVLGAGHLISPTLPAKDQISTATLLRLVEAIRIYKQLPGCKVIGSGNSVSGGTTQAEMVARASIELGVDVKDTLMLCTPSDTSEEVRAYLDRFGDARELILVTNAVHMPRAVEYFRKAGLKPIAAPTNHFIKTDIQGGVYDFIPSVLKIQMMEMALHEYAGFLKLRFF